MTDPTAHRRAAASPTPRSTGKPVLASWMGGDDGRGRRGDPQPGRHPHLRLPRHRRPRLHTTCGGRPTTCAASTRPRRCRPTTTTPPRARETAAAIVDAAARDGPDAARPRSSRSSSWPPTASRPSRPASPRPRTRPSRPPRRSAIPVVLKLHSETITHKTDVGGVQLNLRRRRRRPPRLSRDRDVGRASAPAPEHFQGVTVQPMVQLRRLRADRRQQPRPAVRPGPALRHRRPAGRGLQGPRARPAAAEHHPGPADDGADPDLHAPCKGVRGRKPVDLAALEQLLVRFSQLVVEQPWIKEIDINPLLASPERPARARRPGDRPRPGRAGRRTCPRLGDPPLPDAVRRPLDRQGRHARSRSGRSAPRTSRCWSQFHETLSERSVSLRYFHAMKLSQRVAHERLTRICFIDYDREMALVAEPQGPRDRRARDPRRRPPEQAPRHRRGRVRPARRRPLPGPGARHRAAPPPDPGRPRREHRPDHRRHPPREHRDAAALPEARLPPDPQHPANR